MWKTKTSKSHPASCIHWHKMPGGYNIVNNIAVPRSLFYWAFYKFRKYNSCEEFITSKSVVSKEQTNYLMQSRAKIENNVLHYHIGFSGLDISNWKHIFIIFIQIILKYRSYVPHCQVFSSFHFSILYLSGYYLITFQYLKHEVHGGDVASC